jgi:membrane fusion protein, multidrug efflux system
MAVEVPPDQHRRGRAISIVIILSTVITGLAILRQITLNPRTDDAEVFANYIGIAPVVNGPITHVYVVDNELVKQGAPMFEIDERPYAYALAHAKSDLQALEGEIHDERRIIAGKVSGVYVAKASSQNAEASLARSAASVEQAKADVANARAGVDRADADLAYASDNLHRIQPLLAKQFVTVDQVDQAQTLEATRSQASHQARSQLAVEEAGLIAAEDQYKAAQASLEQSHQQVQEASHDVTTLMPLVGQLQGKQAAIDTAQYDLDECEITAPFDARVTNLTISQGAYAIAGQHIVTLIDNRVWWVIANFRETQLRHIRPGMQAEVYVLSRPNIHFKGVVDSVGFGVTPDADLVGRLSPAGLPDVQRTLNWVHLASRFPVRVRIISPPSDLFRLGESAFVIIHDKSPLLPLR